MKIFKSTLAQFLIEAKPPFYLSLSRVVAQPSGGIANAQCCWMVALSGRNDAGDFCELLLQTKGILAVFYQESSDKDKAQAEEWMEEIRKRLTALDMEILDGRVEQPMLGRIE